MNFYGFRDNIQKNKIVIGILKRKPITGPYSVHLDLTNRCNNDCISCWSYSPLVGHSTMDKETKKKQLPKDLVLRLIADLASMGTREIYFTGGGEPFMHPDALEIMEYVKKKGMRCDMSTNFTLIDNKKAEKMVKTGIDHINCSVWAGTPEAYVETHPSRDAKTFNRITEMLNLFSRLKKRAGKSRPKITLYNVLSTKNYGDFNSMVELAFKTKADAINFTPTDIVPGYTDSLMLSDSQRNELKKDVLCIWDKIRGWEMKYKHKVEFRDYEIFMSRISSKETESGIYDRQIIGKIPCYAGFSFLRVIANGEVNSCLKSGRIPIGNIYGDSIKKLWLSQKQNDFRCHTLNYDVNDPFFKNIGNTTQKGNGCLYCCDNLGWNKIFHEEVRKTNLFETLV
jgi:MoaA/NifB/PqqE/SkfB family radical SAM enzyme